jgi:hypothetical protein
VKDIKPGDLVRIKNQPIGFPHLDGTPGTVIKLKQGYWDYGDGDYGYIDLALVMTNLGVLEVAVTFLDRV